MRRTSFCHEIICETCDKLETELSNHIDGKLKLKWCELYKIEIKIRFTLNYIQTKTSKIHELKKLCNLQQDVCIRMRT